MTFTEYSSVEAFIAYWVGTGLALGVLLLLLGLWSSSWRGFGLGVSP